MPKINLRESISEISKAWNYDVTDGTIPNSFAKAGFLLREKEEINDDVLIDDFLSLDSEAETSETLTEMDILDKVKNKNNTAMNCDEDENDED
ncbi:hypothetical protein AVEN_189499-1 [Araneus ventricosus]|uniref:DDE-1 domain-containing protein n=1 Tax=Araneus ventricosus TaxID=182803 RepID=A0A4Y2SZK1_ARAVE|nr:hypothetical protein AVEN_189499-1 [Araneus ventricosus]